MRDLGDEVTITVLLSEDRFISTSSLIALPFGKRSVDDVTFELNPTFEANGALFVHATAAQFGLGGQIQKAGARDYDYLILAKRCQNSFSVAESLGPVANAFSITFLGDAKQADVDLRAYLGNPGEIATGTSQGAWYYGATSDYLFDIYQKLRKADLTKRVKLHFGTGEPFLGYSGIDEISPGESLLRAPIAKESITALANVAIDSTDEGRINLDDGTRINFDSLMILPPFICTGVAMQAGNISDSKGFVKVIKTFQTAIYDNVYAAGVAAAVPAPWQTPTPVGTPKTGFPTERMAHVAAINTISQNKCQPS